MKNKDDVNAILDKHREEIGEIDQQILDLLKERFKTALSIEKAKRKNGYDIHNPKVEKGILERIEGSLRKEGTDDNMVSVIMAIFKKIIHNSRNLQEKQRQSAEKK